MSKINNHGTNGRKKPRAKQGKQIVSFQLDSVFRDASLAGTRYLVHGATRSKTFSDGNHKIDAKTEISPLSSYEKPAHIFVQKLRMIGTQLHKLAKDTPIQICSDDPMIINFVAAYSDMTDDCQKTSKARDEFLKSSRHAEEIVELVQTEISNSHQKETPLRALFANRVLTTEYRSVADENNLGIISAERLVRLRINRMAQSPAANDTQLGPARHAC